MSDHDVDKAGNPPEVNPDKIEIYHLKERIRELEALLGKWVSHDGHVCPSCGMPDNYTKELEAELAAKDKYIASMVEGAESLLLENCRLKKSLNYANSRIEAYTKQTLRAELREDEK